MLKVYINNKVIYHSIFLFLDNVCALGFLLMSVLIKNPLQAKKKHENWKPQVFEIGQSFIEHLDFHVSYLYYF